MTEVRKNDMFGLSDLAAIHPFFNTWLGKKAGTVLLDLLCATSANDVNRACAGKEPWIAAGEMMEMFGIKMEAENEHILESFPDQAFIAVSNHAYGAIDGIALTHVLGKHRPDFRIMVNEVLLRIYAISDSFIGVRPQVGFKKEQKQSTVGLKEVFSTIRNGHPLSMFPAGAVSMYEDRNYVADRKWQESAIKIIKASSVPVVPIFFHGYNSPYFYKLEKIHIALRTVFMAREVFNKKGYTLRMTVGNPISVEEQNQCETIDELGLLLRNRTYELSGDSRLYTKM